MRNLTYIVSAAAILASSGLAAAATSPGAKDVVVQAHRPVSPDQVLVHYGDLDLKKAAGQRALHKRVNAAITSLCDASHFSAADPTGSLKCSNEAWSSVRPQLASLSAN